MRSIGKPSVSWRKNASSPLTSPRSRMPSSRSTPALQRGAERLLLTLHHRADHVVVVHDLRVGRSHRVDDGVDHRGEQDAARAEEVRVADRTTDDAAEHIAALLVRRADAVGDHEGHRARVLGDDAQRDVDTLVVAVARARRPLRLGEQRREDVDVPDRLGILHDHEVALESGAGVDARLRQHRARAVGVLVVRHEHEIPDLDVAVTVELAVGSERGIDVPEDLRGRPARAGVAHAPEVVLAEALDAVGREPDLRRARSARPRRRPRTR